MLFGIFIYDGVEPIDLATFGVLSMARRIAPHIRICTIAPKAGIISLANGLDVIAQFGIDDAPTCDIVIVTGGPGWERQAASEATLDYIRRVHASRQGRVGVYRRHDPRGQWRARRHSGNHKTCSGAAGSVAARADARARIRRSTVQEAAIVDSGAVVTGRRRVPLHRHDTAHHSAHAG